MTRIAYVHGEERMSALEDRLRASGNRIDGFRLLIPALRAFDTTRYDAILLNSIIAPGLVEFDYQAGPYNNDPKIEQIMEEHQRRSKGRRNPDYWKFTMYAIEVAHKPHALNERTPVFVVGMHNEQIGDALFPNPTEVCREAGAIDYYNFCREERYQALIQDIRRLTT